MSTDESHEKQSKQQTRSVTTDAIDWGSQFVKLLEMEYTDAASALTSKVASTEYRQVMVRAIVAVLVDSGADREEVSRLLHEGVRFDQDITEKADWTSECNSRRMTLIDKMIQQTISAEEAIELERLTTRLRSHVDKEETMPLEGARRLHRRLLEADVPNEGTG